MISLVRGQQDTGASPSLGAVTGMVTGLMKVLGYDDQRLSSMAVNMALYVGELTANSLLDMDNNIDTEMSEYRSFSQSGDIFSLIKVHGNGIFRRHGVMEFGCCTVYTTDTNYNPTQLSILLQLAVMRSTSRGEEIKSTLLDEELPTRMIERLEASAGERSDCIQLFLCKMSPVIAAIQQSASEATSEMFGNSIEYTRSTEPTIPLLAHVTHFYLQQLDGGPCLWKIS